MSEMTNEEEIQYYRKVLEDGLDLISTALGVDCDHYDTDQADGECYLDCFRDAAEVIDISGYRWDVDEAEFLSKKSNEEIERLQQENQHLTSKLQLISLAADEGNLEKVKELIPPSCADVVRELKAEAVEKYNKAFNGICIEMGYPQIANAATTFAKTYANQLSNPEQEKE